MWLYCIIMQDGGVIATEFRHLKASEILSFMLESGTMGLTEETTKKRKVIQLNNSTELSILSISSLFGFVFKLTLPDHIRSPFMGLSANGRTFDVPIQEFIIKLVVVSQLKGDTLAPISVVNGPYVGDHISIPKKPVSEAGFNEEIRIQDYVWAKSVAGSRTPICPPVEYANIIEFSREGNANADKLLTQFNKNLPNGEMERNTIQYLASTIYHRNASGNGGYYYDNRSLGVVLMPAIPGSQTFYDFSLRTDIAIAVVQNVAANIIAQIVRLLIDIQIIHLDLHYANVLVDNKFNSTIIDFGIASQINTDVDDAYFNVGEKMTMKTEIDGFVTEYWKIYRSRASDIESNNKQKRDFIRNVMEYIVNKDANRQARIGKPDGHYQLRWTDEYINNDAIMLSAFDRLYGMMFTNIDKSGDGLSSRTIEKRTSGNLDFPEPDESDEPNTKRRRRGGKSKKSKQTKKSKNPKTTKKSKKSKTL